MRNASKTNCGNCNQPLSPEDTFLDTTICPSCGFYSTDKTKKRRAFLIKLTLVGAVCAGLGWLGWNSYGGLKKVNREEQLAQITDQGVLRDILGKCQHSGDRTCQKAVFQRFLQLNPTEIVYKANLAFVMTNLSEHTDAEKIYQELLADGEGTYDLMAYYGMTLMALNKDAEAEKWFANALSLQPNLVDTTENLAKVLIRQKRAGEAASLLESFIEKYPEAKGMLEGKLVSARDQIDVKQSNVKTMHLLAVNGGHHWLPIQLQGAKSPKMFLVDTGATYVSMKTDAFKASFPESVGGAREAIFLTADGRKISGKIANVPQLQVGPWTIANVQVAFCDSCENLAGRSLLNQFAIKISPRSGLSDLELSHR